MDIKLRELKFQDVFTISRIIKKTGIKDEIKGIFYDKVDESGMENTDVTQEQGLQLALILFENIHRAENEIYEFLSDLSGIDKEKILELSLDETMKLLLSFGQMEGIGNFFGSAAKLMK